MWCVYVWGGGGGVKKVIFFKRFLFNERFALLNELLFISFFLFLLGPEVEEFWSLLLILLNAFFCRFLGLSWINKYDNKTASRWEQVPVFVNYSLNHSDLFKTADSIETKQGRPSEWTAESLAHSILYIQKLYMFLCTACSIKLVAHLSPVYTLQIMTVWKDEMLRPTCNSTWHIWISKFIPVICKYIKHNGNDVKTQKTHMLGICFMFHQSASLSCSNTTDKKY